MWDPGDILLISVFLTHEKVYYSLRNYTNDEDLLFDTPSVFSVFERIFFPQPLYLPSSQTKDIGGPVLRKLNSWPYKKKKRPKVTSVKVSVFTFFDFLVPSYPVNRTAQSNRIIDFVSQFWVETSWVVLKPERKFDFDVCEIKGD